MADGLEIRIEGFSELETALKELPKATQSRVVRRAGIAAGEEIAERARQLVPVDSGRLKNSIRVIYRSLKGSAGKRAFAAAMRGGATRAQARSALIEANRATSGETGFTVTVGTGLPHAHLQEFGTVNHPPHPFMRPAWDALKEQAVTTLKRVLGTEIEKSAARLARKQARAAAKLAKGG